MRELTTFAITSATLCLFGASDGLAHEDKRRFIAPLTGAGQAPRAGDLDGRGTARVQLHLRQKQICYELKVAQITLPAIGAHIHQGAATRSGAVVAALMAPDAGGSSRGCTAISHELAQEIQNAPGRYYVNVHTAEFPAGAIRGQLAPSTSSGLPQRP